MLAPGLLRTLETYNICADPYSLRQVNVRLSVQIFFDSYVGHTWFVRTADKYVKQCMHLESKRNRASDACTKQRGAIDTIWIQLCTIRGGGIWGEESILERGVRE